MPRMSRGSEWIEVGVQCQALLLDLIYPRHCPLCNNVMRFGDKMACDTCLEKQKRIKPPHCMKCGKTIEDETTEYCQDCSQIAKSYNRGFPVFAYEGDIKNALYDFKYKNQRDYSIFFAKCIVEQYGVALRQLGVDGLVPIPVYRSKKRVRGYNQAELLAKQLGKLLQIPVYSQYLTRVVNTNPQKELNDKTRMKNLKNAFKIGENTIKLKKILLVDDIYTTGSTIEACTKVLLQAGVEEVYYTSVAIGKGYSE